MNDKKNRIVIEFDDGTVAIWAVNEADTDRVAALIEEILGQPDTLHC